jgi:hypothetical protein
VLKQVAQLAKDLPASAFSSSKGKGREIDPDALQAVAKWLSDWHLLSFLRLDFVGSLVSEEDFALFVKVASSARSEEGDRLEAVSRLVHSAGWQTMSAFAADAHSGLLLPFSSEAGSTSLQRLLQHQAWTWTASRPTSRWTRASWSKHARLKKNLNDRTRQATRGLRRHLVLLQLERRRTAGSCARIAHSRTRRAAQGTA